MATTVTIAAALVAFPIAYYAARYAQGRWKAFFYLGIMLPLWSSYLVKIYAWKLILAKEGILNWLFARLHLTGLLESVLAIPVIICGWPNVRELSMRSEFNRALLSLKIAAGAGLLFMHLPILLIFVYAFTTEDKTYQWPPTGFTLKWFAVTWNRPDVWEAMRLSVKVASVSTVIALILGTLCAAAVSRTRFFGREAISLLVILPIALPGIITGIALRSAFNPADIPFSFWTIILGHATFCVVVVYNNAVARFRRTSGSLIEASMDLGANGMQTFRYVVLPNIATALLAGGMLAFALSFDEVIVTTFTAGQQATLPIWMLEELVRPRQRPVTNVVAMVVVLMTFLPILAAYYLTRGGDDTRGHGK